MEKDFGDMKTTGPLNTASSDNGEAGMGLHPAETVQHDAVFGEATKEGPNYRSLGWIATVVVMLKIQIGLGVLSLPFVFDTIGMIPGVILLLVVGIIATYTSWMVGVFKRNHPEVYSIDDAGAIIAGRIGREFFAIAILLWMIFVAGSGMLGVSIGLNAVSKHATCTAVFVFVACFFAFMLASIRTLGRLSWLAWVGMACIATSIFLVTIAVGVQDRPALAPQDVPWKSDFKLFGNPTFAQGVGAYGTLLFACSATPTYYALVAEMKDPRMYTRSLVIAQAGSTAIYLTIAVVVYYYCGSYVASPALGSAGPLIKRISYGIALPGLIVTTTLFIHLPAKYLFVRFLRGSRHLTANTFTHWATWLGCTFGSAIASYLIASGIPIFGGLVSLIGALFNAILAYQPAGAMWLFDNWKSERTWKWWLMAAWSMILIVGGTFVTITGTWGAITEIVQSLKDSAQPAPWTCADNSG
ncbi:hypothetical protein CC79DRAFT_704940 [Sarocladium strictum]